MSRRHVVRSLYGANYAVDQLVCAGARYIVRHGWTSEVYELKKGRTQIIAMGPSARKLVHYIAWERAENYAFIGLAYTDVNFRRRHYYRECVEELITDARKQGLLYVRCGVGATNVVSLAAHELIGFKQYVRQKGAIYYELGLV